jgi:hypothetical protein
MSSILTEQSLYRTQDASGDGMVEHLFSGGGTMLKVLKLFVVVLAAAALMLVVTPVANAQEPTTFVVELSAEIEIPGCPQGVDSGAGGYAVVQIDEATGEISYRVVAFKLPGTVRAQGLGGHIHIGGAAPALWPLGRRPTRHSPTRFSTTLRTTTSTSIRMYAQVGPSGDNSGNHAPICRAGAQGP